MARTSRPSRFYNAETAPWLWALAGMAIFFFLFSYLESINRSYHIDEEATIREGMRRLQNPNFQRQHGLFLDFYRWLSGFGMQPNWLRLPSILASMLGLILTAGATWRIAGGRAAVASGAILLSVPLFWLSGIEIRFYGYMFFFGAVSLCGALAAGRGWVITGTILTAVPAYVSYRFHPAGLPFHGMLFGFVMLATVRECVRAIRGPYDRAWKWVVLGFGLILLLGAIGAAVRVVPEVQRLATNLINRPVNHEGEMLPDGWPIGRLVGHVLSWSGHGPSDAWDWCSSILLAIGVAAGAAWLLAKRRFMLAGVLTVSVLVHYVAAFFIAWNTIFAVKYLISSLPVVVLLCGLAIEAGLQATGKIPARIAIIAVVALGFCFSGVYDVSQSFQRDPSNVRPIARLIDQHTPQDARANLVAPMALTQLIAFQEQLGLNRGAKGYARETVTTAAEHALVLRDAPFFKAEIHTYGVQAIGGLPVAEAFERTGPYVSSFHEHFTYNVWRLTAEPVLAPGMSGTAIPNKRIGFVEGGRWRVEAPGATRVMIGGREFDDGDSVVIEEGTALDWHVEPQGTPVRLVPDFASGALRRSGVYANESTIGAFNRPEVGDDGMYYLLTNNTNASYDFDFPEGAAMLVVETRANAPVGGGFIAKFGEEVAGIYGMREDNEDGEPVQFRIPVPEWALGRRERFSVVFFGETHAREADSDKVRVFPIVAVGVEQTDAGDESENLMRALKFPSYPPEWTAGGVVDLTSDDAVEHWEVRRVNLEEENQVRMEKAEDGLRFHLPEVVAVQAISLPLMGLETGEAIVFELEARTHNVGRYTMVPLVYYFTENLVMTHVGELSQLPYRRQETEWTTRTGFATTPKGAKLGMFLLYINVPEGEETNTQPDAYFEIRSLRFLEPK